MAFQTLQCEFIRRICNTSAQARSQLRVSGISTSSIVLSHIFDARDKDHEKKQLQVTNQQELFFDRLAEQKKARDKATFIAAIDIYKEKEKVHRRGHVEFMYAAMNKMREFKVHKDIDAYRAILDCFPKGKMIPETVWQVEFMHYPKQQQCCIDILDHMEGNRVIPDDAMGYQLVSVFGERAHAFRKYRRMMYWLPKMKYASPYFVPLELPTDKVELAKMALGRMSIDIDLQAKLSVFQSLDAENASDDTFIVSSQSPEQMALLRDHSTTEPLFVEGGFNVWLRHICMKYFILRANVTQRFLQFEEKEKEAEEDQFDFNWNFLEKEKPDHKVAIPPSKHEQDDGTIVGICITGTSSKDSLASWIKFLQKDNPTLQETPVVFLLKTPEAGLVPVYDGDGPLDGTGIQEFDPAKMEIRTPGMRLKWDPVKQELVA